MNPETETRIFTGSQCALCKKSFQEGEEVFIDQETKFVKHRKCEDELIASQLKKREGMKIHKVPPATPPKPEPVKPRFFSNTAAAKVHAALRALFEEQHALLDTKELLDGRPVSAVDAACVVLCEAKTTEAKLALWRFINYEKAPATPPKLIKQMAAGGAGSFGIDKIAAIVRVLDESTKANATGKKQHGTNDPYIGMQTGSDMPAVLWNRHFRFWVAPRIREDAKTPEGEHRGEVRTTGEASS